jgi:S-adenosylmethionine hydrolase
LRLVIRHQSEIVFDKKVLFHKSFGFAPIGDVIIYNNEFMKVALAISQGNFCKVYNLEYGPVGKLNLQNDL